MNAKRLLLFASLLSVALSLWALPTEVKNKDFFEAIKYKWPYNAAPADQTESNLAQIATDPDQIIAMLRTVYMDKTIPGNYVRGYDANSQNEGTWENGVATGNYPVAYPSVGRVNANQNFEYGFSDSYGWGLNGDLFAVSTDGTVTFEAKQSTDRSRSTFVSKSGITVSMYQMYGYLSTGSVYYS